MKENIKSRLNRWAIWKERAVELGYATETPISKMMEYGELIGNVIYNIDGIDYNEECQVTDIAINKLSQEKITIINDHFRRKGNVKVKPNSAERRQLSRNLNRIYKELDEILDEIYQSLENLSLFC